MIVKEKKQKIYINGKLDCERTSGPLQTNSVASHCQLYIGEYAGSRPLRGCLGSFRIWKMARTAEQIQQHMYLSTSLIPFDKAKLKEKLIYTLPLKAGSSRYGYILDVENEFICNKNKKIKKR